MPVAPPRKFVLDTNCFVDASRSDAKAVALAEFCAWAAAGLYLSTVVAAELRAGAGAGKDRRTLERHVLSPYLRRAPRRIRNRRADWRRRYGRGLSGARYEAESRRRAEDPAGRLCERCRSHGAFHAGGADTRRAEPSQHRAHLWAG